MIDPVPLAARQPEDDSPADDPSPAAVGARPARPERSRAPLYVALFVVAVISGGALFVSGFTLGAQQSLTPGTSAQDQGLFEPFWEAWNKVTAEYVGEYESQVLVEGAIQGVFEALGDPYSSYMTSEQYRESLSAISGEFEGIGAELAAEDAQGAPCETLSDACQLVVKHVLRSSPALAAGLIAGDIVRTVDGERVDGGTAETTVDRVRGPKGSPVELGLERGGRMLELTIVRDVIQTEQVTSQVLADGQVGYLKVDGFSAGAADELIETLTGLVEDQDLDKIILDLRDDPGGFVEAAHRIASQFIAAGPIYWEESADGTQRAIDADPGGVAIDPSIELVLLVNGGSASASEIVAGALQDTGRATLVGTSTFGKGTIQQWHELNGGAAGGFRLSVFKWLTPDKTWIHGIGVTPDVVVAAPDPADGTDPQLERAVDLLTTETGSGRLLAA